MKDAPNKTAAPKTKEADNAKKLTLEVSEEQAEQLTQLFEMTKALAAPTRLAILGALATRMKQSVTIEELATGLKLSPVQLGRDLRQLAELGFIRIEEWQATKPGHEPEPALIAFNLEEYTRKLMPQMISTLSHLSKQVRPAEQKPEMDERAKTLDRFMKNGRLTGWPVQPKRQAYLAEEIAKVFEPVRRYSEREIDAILKEIYEYDHCTLRRYLVDLKLLQRADGVYWKV